MEDDVRDETRPMKDDEQVTWHDIATLTPVFIAVVSGVAAFFSLQVQITELKTRSDTEMAYLKTVITELRDDVKALRETQEERKKNNANQ